MSAVDAALLARLPLPALDDDVDKDARGRVLAVGGSRACPGGIVLAAIAALRAGAGKLQIATVASVAPGLALTVPEALVVALDETSDGAIARGAADAATARLARCDTLLVGPGMSAGDETATFVGAVAAACTDATLVLDAAALAGPLDTLRDRRAPTILTPHAGEMATLLGVDKAAVDADPTAHATAAAARFDAVVLCKGGTTVIATPGGDVHHHAGGGPGLATSGSGDVLAGVIAGLAARGADALTAAAWGVWAHGEAGRTLARTVAPLGFLARELLREVPRVLASAPGRG